MQFEVNGQNYFLNFVPEKGRWFLFQPTRTGFTVLPVVDDDRSFFLPEDIDLNGDVEVVN
ncbi:MAG: hypothetical protein ACR2IF_15365 [Terriglobales bacterium]